MEPEHIDTVLDRANRLLEAGKPDESLRCLDQVDGQLVDSDDRIECAALRAYALSEMGRAEEALQTLEPLIEEFPESARLFGALGVVLSGANDLEQAREALETAIALDQEDETLLANLALVYERLRDYATAVELYDRAIDLGADLDWALRRRATALVESGDSAAARATLKRYLSLVPDDAEQWVSLAILHSDDEQYEDAFACYQRAEQAEADSPVLRLNWGVTAVRAGRLDDARRQLDFLRRLDPDSARPRLLQAFILEERGDIRAALRCYGETVERIRPDDFGELTYVFEMAMDFYARRKMHARCEKLLKQAYEANACTVELCEAYRQLTGQCLRRGYWFNLVLEADYRDGLCEVHERGAAREGRAARFQRSFQVVAADRDEAAMLALAFARRMGETELSLCEFVREEVVDDAHTGIYEVEKESLVLAPA